MKGTNKRTETIEGKCCRKILGQKQRTETNVGQKQSQDRDKRRTGANKKTEKNLGQEQTKGQKQTYL